MDSLGDRVYPATRRSNASECDVTFEQYCSNEDFIASRNVKAADIL